MIGTKDSDDPYGIRRLGWAYSPTVLVRPATQDVERSKVNGGDAHPTTWEQSVRRNEPLHPLPCNQGRGQGEGRGGARVCWIAPRPNPLPRERGRGDQTATTFGNQKPMESYKFTQIKEDIFAVLEEEDGKERLRELFKGNNKNDFIKILA